MKRIAQIQLALLIGLVAVVVAAGTWLGVAAWRSSAERSTAPATPALAFQGALAHNWNGAITGDCDFRFQLWDADINGTPTGDAVEVDNVGVRDGSFDLAMPASRLGGAGVADWLAVALRCDDGDWETLAPRMQHQAIAQAGAAAAGWDIPAAALLVCSVPAADGSTPEHEPVIAGVNYRLEGGFRLSAAAGSP